MSTYTEQDWRPIAKGQTYCSPACGGGCTKAEWRKAHEEANRIAQELGEGWEPVVWENLGWFAKAVKNHSEVSFHQYFSDAYYIASLGGGSFSADSGESASQALENVTSAAKRSLEETVEHCLGRKIDLCVEA